VNDPFPGQQNPSTHYRSQALEGPREGIMEFNVLIGGEAGQGMFSVEMDLSEILSRLGYHFFATKNYM